MARLGGDEFAVLLPDVGDDAKALEVAHKLLESLRRSFEIDGLSLEVGASIGTAVLTVVLTHQLADRLPAGGGSGEGLGTALPAAAREKIAPLMADAFGATFWWAFGLLLVALAAAFLLPRTKPEAPVDEEHLVAEEAAPVLIHA